MSTRAFAGSLVGAFVIATLLARLSYWLGLLSVIIAAVFLLLAWKDLPSMRRVVCSVALGWFVLCWIGFTGENKRITLVKNMTCPANERYTIGEVLDTVCQRPRWRCFPSREEEGTHIVEFTGKTKKGPFLLQFGVKGSDSTGEFRYAEFDGNQMSFFQVATFFSQAYDQYVKKRGE